MEETVTEQASKRAFHDAFGYGDEDHDIHPDMLFEEGGLIKVSSSEELDELVDKINKTYFYLVIGKNGYVASIDYDSVFKRKAISYLTPHTFHELHAARTVLRTDIEDSDPESITKIWMRHPKRRQYKGIIFAPDEIAPKDKFNLWQDFRQDEKEGDCSLFLDFVSKVICNQNPEHYKYVLAWMADAIQNITEKYKPGVALVLRGDRGTGKGFFAKKFGSLFKHYFVHVTNSQHLVGKFNRHLQDCLLLFADEMAGSKTTMGILQGLITEPTILIEIKGQDAFQAPNYMRFIVASNFDWVVPAGPNERRWAVFDVSNCHMQDAPYFAKLDASMKNGGREALLHYLLNHDYSKVDLRKIPKTSALADQLVATMDGIEAYWYTLLQKGSYPGTDNDEVEWGSALMVKDVIYQDYHKGQKGFTHNQTAVWVKVRKLCPNLKEVRPSTIGYKRAFEVPPLKEARDLFDKSFGHKFPWEGEIE